MIQIRGRPATWVDRFVRRIDGWSSATKTTPATNRAPLAMARLAAAIVLCRTVFNKVGKDATVIVG
jgi:hypothetical protein